MKLFFYTLILFSSSQIFAASPWLDKINSSNKQQQLDLRWKAQGGQVDIRLMHKKLNEMHVEIYPKSESPEKHWTNNHMVFDIQKTSALEIKMPYGNIEKITNGMLSVNANLSFSNGENALNIYSFNLIPTTEPLNKSDIVTFHLVDQDNRHLFTVKSVHIEYDKSKELLLMSNMDLFATKTFAEVLNNPYLENQVVGQLNTYSKLEIPLNAKTNLQGGSCDAHPIWPPEGSVDVALIDIGSIQYLSNHNSTGLDSEFIVIAPSAELKNVGTADVPWHFKYSGSSPPYDNDQHPFLTWSIYREIDGRFEQLSNSGVKHAFLTINSNCDINCGDNHILWLGCEDVYGVGNNDSSSAMGPRHEIEADSGEWDNCGTFFDPEPCTGSQVNFSNQEPGQFRLIANTSELTDTSNTNMYLQAWYLIRDDVNIFNSMGYRSINPTEGGGGWDMNAGNTFSNGAALDNYVDSKNIGENEYTHTIETGEGQFAVAVKVQELENGMFRYNYAVENYEFDPRFNSYKIPMPPNAILDDIVFHDPDQDKKNDWQFTLEDGYLTVSGDETNQQDWGMMFSFSFTTNFGPAFQNFELTAANLDELNDLENQTVQATSLIPDTYFKSGFE